ncbi:hypothetical protein GCM10023238_14980 [Streptomyces heliomycini]
MLQQRVQSVRPAHARSDRHLRLRDLRALLAVRKNFDVFGIAVLAEVTALAADSVRDLSAAPYRTAGLYGPWWYFVTRSLSRHWSWCCLASTRARGERYPVRVGRSRVFDDGPWPRVCSAVVAHQQAKAYDYGLGLTASACLGLAIRGRRRFYVLRDVLANEVAVAAALGTATLYGVPPSSVRRPDQRCASATTC